MICNNSTMFALIIENITNIINDYENETLFYNVTNETLFYNVTNETLFIQTQNS